MVEYVVVCVDRAGDGEPRHDHIYQALVRPITGGAGKLLSVKDIRRGITFGIHRFFSFDADGNREQVMRYRCGCGYRTIRTGRDDTRDNNLTLKVPCT